MRIYDFSFQNSYSGFWEIPEMDGIRFQGNLILNKHSIKLEFYLENRNINLNIKRIIGHSEVFGQNSNCGMYYFELYDTSYAEGTVLGEISHYVLDVKYFIIFTEKYNPDKIKGVCIRSCQFDNWARESAHKGFDVKLSDNDHFKLEFTPQGEITLYEDKQNLEKINLYYSWRWCDNQSAVIVDTRNFLNVKFEKFVTFDTAYNELEKVSYLFFLLFNNVCEPEYTMFRTETGDFILKTSDRYSFHYNDSSINLSPYTRLEEFKEGELDLIFSKWFSLYDSYKSAIETYFETISNNHASYSNKIKNFISTIDALTEGLKGPTLPTPKNTRNGKFLNGIFTKTEGILSEQEKKHLTDLVFKESPRSLKPRLRNLLTELHDIADFDEDGNYVEKIVNTRNCITHPNNAENEVFKISEYEDEAYKLAKIIRIYFLKSIGVNNKIIRRIINF